MLNLMPVKKVAETDFIRNLSNTSLQVELDLLYMDEHESKNAPHVNTWKSFTKPLRKSPPGGMTGSSSLGHRWS